MSKPRHAKVPYILLNYDGFEKFAPEGVDKNRLNPNTIKAIYVAILHGRQGNSKDIKIKQRKLSEITGLCTEQVGRNIAKLVEHGFISVTESNNIFGCHTYTIQCDETKNAPVPWEIAFEMGLTATELIAYAIIKKHTDLNSKEFMSYGETKQWAIRFKCSEKHVYKIKRALMEKGIISFNRSSNAIELTWELNNYKQNRKQHVRNTVNSKNMQEEKNNANADII